MYRSVFVLAKMYVSDYMRLEFLQKKIVFLNNTQKRRLAFKSLPTL